MAYNLSSFSTRTNAVIEWLKTELSAVRTGKASPLVLDRVWLEAYGSKSELKHSVSISVQDARSLYVSPWDKSLIGAIQKAIDAANLGVSTAADSDGVRVNFPELTGERRTLLTKLVGQKLEEARITLRSEREKVWNDIQAQEKAGLISEDDKFRAKEELQKYVDETGARLESLAQSKRAELAE